MLVTVTSLLGAVCHQFESDQARQGPVAQLVAQRQKVRAAFLCFLYQSDSACVGYFNQELLILSIETFLRHSFSSPAIQKFIRQ